MSRSSTQKKTTAPAPAATPRARNSPPLRRASGSSASASAAHLTSQRIATDLASFKKSGGRIEVLGNTPLRPYTSRTTSRKTAAATDKTAATVAPAAKAKK
ncbi:hypothetical protein [Luteimonas terricola]|uniref:Histone H1 n=1 Tax=Luteimonas terricola TaxID=645597 RepID=A0ABQ2EAN9_9GAMM|nr:hypothetical protein [Luteimonas terricola]GGK03989.1 hypothetical protein GCM10011394_11180 [Luteimonas terricola]